MTKEDFQKLWALNYPDAIPSSYLFKLDFTDRWFRIHSLPESKRYADNEDEWKVILARQNEIITDLLGTDTPVFLVTGDYVFGDDQQAIHITEEEPFSCFAFTRLDTIELPQADYLQSEELEFYRPAFTQTVWKINDYNNILVEIAKDNIRAFFVSFNENVIVAPYDGGVDFVLKDSWTKEKYKQKYSSWLSKRADGF